MRRLVIAIDCDDVLIDATDYLVREYNRLYDTKVQKVNAHTSKNLEWQAERDEVFRRLHAIQLSDDYTSITPAKQTIQAVKRLAQDHELHLVTARASEVTAVTNRMVEDYFPGCFTSIEHVGSDRPKGAVCAALAADILIDDNLKNLETAHESGIDYLLWFGEYEWQDESGDTPHVVRCRDWLGVEAEIERIAR